MRHRIVCLLFIALYGYGCSRSSSMETSSCARKLPEDATTRIALAGGETHCYAVPMKQGQNLTVAVDQHLVDVALTWRAPNGTTQTMDGRYGSSGDEWLWATAPSDGIYELVIQADIADAETSGYHLSVQPSAAQPSADDLDQWFAARALCGQTTVDRLRKHEALVALKRRLTQPHADTPPTPSASTNAFTALAWQTVADLAADLRDDPTQLDALMQASDFFGHSTDFANQCFTALDAAKVADRLGENQNAALLRQRAYAFSGSAAKPHIRARVRSHLAFDLMRKGRYQQALALMEESLAALKALDDHAGSARQLEELGMLRMRLADFQGATQDLNEAAALWQTLNFPRNMLLAKSELAWTHHFTGSHSLGISQMEDCIKGLSNDYPTWAVALNDRLGTLYLRNKDYASARDFYQKVLDSETVADDQKAATLLNIAKSHVEQDAWPKAEAFLKRALKHYKPNTNPLEYLSARMLQARCLVGQGQPEQAQDMAEKALNQLFHVRNGMQDAAVGLRFMGPRHHYLDFFLDLLWDLHQQQPLAGFDLKALQFFEMFQSHFLIQAHQNQTARRRLSPSDRAEAATLRAQRRVLTTRLIDLDHRTDAARHTRLNLAKVEAKERRLLENRVQPARAEAVSRASVTALARTDQAHLLVFHLGKTRSYLWLINETGITWHPLPNRDQLMQEINYFQELFQDEPGKKTQSLDETAAALGLALLKPLAPTLHNANADIPLRLIIVADDHLANLPFGALHIPNSGQPLITKAALSFQPSLTFSLLRRQSPPNRPQRNLLLMADPDYADQESALPELEPEVSCLQALVPEKYRTVRTKDAAALTEWRQLDVADYALIHIGGHGETPFDGGEYIPPQATENNVNPANKALLLAREQPGRRGHRLTLPEVQTLNLEAELVTLSACYSGVGDVSLGEGVFGLDEAFLGGGARRTLAALHRVDDTATRKLMCAFYPRLLRDKKPVDQALRQAQLSVRAQAGFADPRYWAGFALNGDPNAFSLPQKE